MSIIIGVFKSVLIVLLSLCVTYMIFHYGSDIEFTVESFMGCIISAMVTMYTIELISLHRRLGVLGSVINDTEVVNS